jgi:hypothetical protein
MDKQMGWRRRGAWLTLGAAGTVAVMSAAIYWVLPLAVRGLVLGLRGFLQAVVWLASALGSGADAWTITGTIGRAMASALTSTEMLTVVVALVLVSAVALYGLRRLLGFKEESSQ